MDALPAQPSESRKWYEIWWTVLSHPGKETFRSVLQAPDANSSRGFIWVAVVTLIAVLIASLSSYPLMKSFMRSSTNTNLSFGIFIVILVVEVILGPILAIVGLAIGAAIFHGIARLFGGMGQWGQMVFCLAAISAPFSLLSAAINLISLPFTLLLSTNLSFLLSCCIGPIALALGIYSIVLQVSAIDAVESIGIGKAIATFFIPAIILIVLTVCCTLTILVPLITSNLPQQF
jgi:hypothetical protein